MDILLRAKHWQIFLLTTGLPVVLGIIFFANMMGTVLQMAPSGPDPARLFSAFSFMPFIILLPLALHLAWLWAVAINLQKFAPAGIVFKDTLFKIFLICIVTINALIIGIAYSTAENIMHAVQTSGVPDVRFFIAFVAIIPLSLFCVFCVLYCFYYTAKTLKTVELQRPVEFGDFVLECFLIWFFFVGVWILQPEINKMVAQSGSTR